MSTPLKTKVIKAPTFDYWLHNGREPGKGQLQLFIDKLPAITNTILQDGDLTIDDQIIIQAALIAGVDIKIMSKNWPKRLVLLQENLTAAQVNQAISNKLAVEALNAKVVQLLLQLQNAFEQKGYNWETQKKNIIRKVDQHYRQIDQEKRSVGPENDLDMSLATTTAIFDYWLHDGSERGKGQLQYFIDKLPAITQNIIQGVLLTLADEEVIYDATFGCDDIKIMSQNFPERMLMLQKNLTTEQVSQLESNKSAVEALNVQVVHLLLLLQIACDSHNRGWAMVKADAITNVNQSRKKPRGKRGVGDSRNTEMLLLQLKEYYV
jgi:hypothetical protein